MSKINLRGNFSLIKKNRIWFRPRIMRDVTNVRFDTKILGHPTSMPLYITATG